MPNFAKPALLLMACSALCAANQWEVLDDVQLPKALSDNTATATPSGQILVAGGCDAPNGNTFIDAEGNQLDFFICESISDELYAFDPVEGSFTTLAKLPRYGITFWTSLWYFIYALFAVKTNSHLMHIFDGISQAPLSPCCGVCRR